MRAGTEFYSSHKWRKLRAKVIADEPYCQLRLPGCLVLATCVDHIIPRSLRPDLEMTRSNLASACKPCNDLKGDRQMNDVAALPRGTTGSRPAALAFFCTCGANSADCRECFA
jgi:5-methylcytosine-specific restriction endonuclease McrA